ncbi:uncharacterized protein EKO05_0006720 [Ascochyta rabiei]|uniref:uncharacterized protein n=1 Tax=Didymella rabiei TaxID=5454 RepID=UPI0022036B8B|nr:uncharacterized protein EKO05_0006720 [Ascochyta rabiei]UPX16311.1 hypothetical protein EKO05_0006720 [Ascochyta rabiei]
MLLESRQVCANVISLHGAPVYFVNYLSSLRVKWCRDASEKLSKGGCALDILSRLDIVNIETTNGGRHNVFESLR